MHGMEVLLYIFILLVAATSIEAAQDAHEDNKRILLNDNYYTIISQLESLTKQMANVSKSVESIFKKLESYSKDIESLKTKTANNSSVVAFIAKLTTDVTGTGHHIYFDDVTLNIGNAYNPHHGTFVAPVDGTYEFSLKACSNGAHVIVLDIMVNTAVAERLLAGDSAYTACSSTTVPVHLTSGDDVYVKQGPHGDLLYVNQGYGVPQFNGVLIQAD